MTGSGQGDFGAADLAVLDDEAVRRRIDVSDMAGAIAGLPGQLEAAAERAATIELPAAARGSHGATIVGMGGSAIGADLVRDALGSALTRPVTISRGRAVPGWAREGELVIAVSHSGRTAETLSAARMALEQDATLVAVTTGGPLADLATESGGSIVRYPGGGQPRASVGHLAGSLAGVLAAAGFLPGLDVAAELRAAARAVEERLGALGPAVPVESNPAKQLAGRLLDRLPVVVGSEHLAPVARRWKTQLNENAETWAIAEEIPELLHNAVVGFGVPDWSCEQLFAVFLAPEDEPAFLAARRAIVAEGLGATGTAYAEVGLPALPPLAQAFAGVVTGDLVSLHLALLRGVDPTPVPAIESLKVRLAG